MGNRQQKETEGDAKNRLSQGQVLQITPLNPAPVGGMVHCNSHSTRRGGRQEAERTAGVKGKAGRAMAEMTVQQMAEQLSLAYERLWWVISLCDDDELEHGVMADGWSPKVLIGQCASWNIIHMRRMLKVVRPDLHSFIERANGGLSTKADIERLRAREPMRSAVDARLPLDAVLAELERSQKWITDLLTDPQGVFVQHTAAKEDGDANLRLAAIFEEMLGEIRRQTRQLRRWAGSMERWTKAELIQLLEAQHQLLMDSIAGLDEATIVSTITHAPWSMRDELTHVLAWNEFELRLIDGWPNPQKDDVRSWLNDAGETEDEINDRLAAERIDMNMIDVVDALATVHRRIVKRLEAADDALLASTGDWFFGVSGELSDFVYAMALHQAEHSEWLWRTRKTLEEKPSA